MNPEEFSALIRAAVAPLREELREQRSVAVQTFGDRAAGLAVQLAGARADIGARDATIAALTTELEAARMRLAELEPATEQQPEATPA